MSEFHAEVPQAAASEGLAQGPHVAARAGLLPVTLRTKGAESTNEPPRPTRCLSMMLSLQILSRPILLDKTAIFLPTVTGVIWIL